MPRLPFIALAAVLAASAGAGPAAAASEPYIGEIMFVGANYCPRGWVPADGRTLPINQNQALFSLFGFRYGGDGQTTFRVPRIVRQMDAELVVPGYVRTTPLLACVALQGIFPPRD
jgi:microcystin-dependent protein